MLEDKYGICCKNDTSNKSSINYRANELAKFFYLLVLLVLPLAGWLLATVKFYSRFSSPPSWYLTTHYYIHQSWTGGCIKNLKSWCSYDQPQCLQRWQAWRARQDIYKRNHWSYWWRMSYVLNLTMAGYWSSMLYYPHCTKGSFPPSSPQKKICPHGSDIHLSQLYMKECLAGDAGLCMESNWRRSTLSPCQLCSRAMTDKGVKLKV